MSEKVIRAHVKKIVDDARDRLMEHVGTVRIFVSLHDDESQTTGSYTVGGGNYFGQLGQVNEWLVRQQSSVPEEDEEDD